MDLVLQFLSCPLTPAYLVLALGWLNTWLWVKGAGSTKTFLGIMVAMGVSTVAYLAQVFLRKADMSAHLLCSSIQTIIILVSVVGEVVLVVRNSPREREAETDDREEEFCGERISATDPTRPFPTHRPTSPRSSVNH